MRLRLCNKSVRDDVFFVRGNFRTGVEVHVNQLFEQLKNIWSQMNTTRRILVVSVPIVILITILILVRWFGAPKYELLYASLNEQDRSEVISKLEEMRVSYRMSPGGGLEVPNAVSVRASLLMAGIPRGGVVGWEIFDKSSFSATDFNNEINRQRAIAGELTRTLQNLAGISDAKVLLNIPDSGEYLFADDRPEGTVSVQLQLRMAGALTKAQVEAIVNLVAASTGVKAENVTIIDNYANNLTSILQLKQNRHSLGAATNLFETKLEYENQLEKRTENMLAKVFGFNKAVVQVNAELDLDYQEVKSENYGDKVPRSEQEHSEISNNNQNTNGGVPGTDSNIPQYKENQATGDNYNSEKSDRTVNYEINRSEEFRVVTPGKVKRLTIGVWVDGDLPEVTKQKIINTLSASAGIFEERGDRLTVETIKFNRPKEAATSTAKNETGLPWQQIAIGLMGLILLLGGALFLKKRQVKEKRLKEEVELANASVGKMVDELVGTSEEAQSKSGIEISPEEKMWRENIATIERMAHERPEDVAILIRAWLADD